MIPQTQSAPIQGTLQGYPGQPLYAPQPPPYPQNPQSQAYGQQPPYSPPPASWGQPAAEPPRSAPSLFGSASSTPAQQPGERKLPPAVVALGAAAGIMVLLGILYVFVLPHRASGTAKADTGRAEAPPAGPASTNPYAKYMEISGVRITEDKTGKARINLVVINHSSADLPEMKMDVSIRSGGRDFFVVPVKLPSIGPYESKEISTTVRTTLKPYELPDWQMIQPRFTIAAE